MEIKIFLTNVAEFAKGNLTGEWLELPMDIEELEEAKKRILKGDEELFITDYNAPFRISQYANVEELNELAERLEDTQEDEAVVGVIFNNLACSRSYDDIVDLIENRDYNVVWECWDGADLAQNIDHCMLPFNYEEMEEKGVIEYINWDAVGNHFLTTGWHLYSAGEKHFALCLYK